MNIMPRIIRGGIEYSGNGYDMPATNIKFSAGNSGLTSENVNDAIIELSRIVSNAVSQFAYHNYKYDIDTGKTVMEFLKDSLISASHSVGGFHLFYLEISEDKHYIGLTMTCNTSCSFNLRSIENPSIAYYGVFDTIIGDSAGNFTMFKINTDGENLFDSVDFTI